MGPELRAVAAKVRGIIHMFKPTPYGLQFAKNLQVSKFVRYLLTSVNTELQVVQSKKSLFPSKASLASDAIMEVLGEGLRIKLDSWSVHAQGREAAVDKLLHVRELFGSVLKTEPSVLQELQKMAAEIKLNKPDPADQDKYKSFIQSYNLGYEYAFHLTMQQMMKLISEMGQYNIREKLGRGVSGEIVSAANLIFAEFQGPTELGLPMVTRRDMVSVMAAKAYAKTAPVGLGITAGLVPVWNLKHQSDSGIVPPFKVCSQCSVNGYSGHGGYGMGGGYGSGSGRGGTGMEGGYGSGLEGGANGIGGGFGSRGTCRDIYAHCEENFTQDNCKVSGWARRNCTKFCGLCAPGVEGGLGEGVEGGLKH